jgi:cell division protease FtsH
MPPPYNKKPAGFNWQSVLLFLAVWLLVSYFFRGMYEPTSRELPYTEFKQVVTQGRIHEVTLKGSGISGQMQQESAGGEDAAREGSGQRTDSGMEYFTSRVPEWGDPELLELLEENNVTVNVKSSEDPWYLNLIVWLLPWLLIIGFFVYTSRKMRDRFGGGGLGGPFGFGKSKAKLYQKSKTSVTLDDVAGLGNAKKELAEIIEFLKNPEKFQKIGAKLPRGILLVGPPGTGKTLMARATAGEADVPFFSISGSEFIEMFVGVGASRVRDMFENAKKEAPSIIFIDEIDAIGRVRGTGLGGGHDEREQTLNQILSEMDGFSASESVMVMAATNRPDVLDPALIRPGRFDRQVVLENPMKEARLEILQIHTKKMQLADDVNLEEVAKRTVGFSGADLENLANEAALLAARHDKERIEAADFDESIDKITLGIERDDFIGEKERKIIAYHEVGHALMAILLPGADPLKKVSIIPHGRALGATLQLPEEERRNLGRGDLLNKICILLGGTTAEKIIFNDITTGAANDLKKATELARRMVTEFGMSDKIGPAVFPQGEIHPFLGREIAQEKKFSEHTAQLIDDEIMTLLNEKRQKVEKLLSDNKGTLKQIAEKLLDEETLDNEQIEEIMGGAKEKEESKEQRKEEKK